jgi:outer membrane lipoprotein-sorting protein
MHSVPLALALMLASLSVLSTAAQPQTTDEIVAKYLVAKGGAEKLRAIMTVKMTATIRGRSGEVPVTSWTKRPNMIRREQMYEGHTIVVAYDGKTVWAVNPMISAAPREITGPQSDMTRQDADDFDTVLLDYKEKGYKVELVATQPVSGLATHHLRVTKKSGRVQDIYLNAETLLESKITMEVEQAGRKALVSTEFSNYKAVDGIMVPFLMKQSFNGQIVAEVAYTQVQFNLPIDDALFRMPLK